MLVCKLGQIEYIRTFTQYISFFFDSKLGLPYVRGLKVHCIKINRSSCPCVNCYLSQNKFSLLKQTNENYTSVQDLVY